MEEKELILQIRNKLTEVVLLIDDYLQGLPKPLNFVTAEEKAKPEQAEPSSEVKPAEPRVTLELVKNRFPPELQDKLSITEEGDFLKVQPKVFLGLDNFKQVASVVRELGGDYVKAGKNSHFKIKKE
jgi:hypothetical protein